ncbi:MAG: hypothetical protein HS128_18185, partial [Ideonella sp.]|nr:hypothetical protein [Ideonella sp.]
GGDGNDVIHGGDGLDTLIGGIGDDRLWGEAGADTLDGGSGEDHAHYENSGAGVQVDLNNAGPQVSTGDASGDVLISIESVHGATNFDNELIGTAGLGEHLKGGDFSDTITGNGGTGGDYIDAQGGDDTLIFNSGDVVLGTTISGGTGSDTLVVQTSTDFSPAGAFITGIEEVEIGAGQTATFGDDQIDGQAWNINGAFGSTETLQVSMVVGTSLDLSGLTFGPDWDDTPSPGDQDSVVVNGSLGDDTVIGSSVADTVFGDDDGDAMWGGAGNDTLDGGAGNDRMGGGNTTSTTETGSGNDTLSGGAGNDEMHGADGNDLLDGGADHDTINGGSGFDRLIGGSGTNTLNGNDGDDILTSGGSNDTLDGGSGGESYGVGDQAVLDRSAASGGFTITLDAQQGGTLQHIGDGTRITNIERLDFTGGAGNDNVTGLSDGALAYGDILRGRGGNDTLDGGGGPDQLFGGAGNDLLAGGIDNDNLYGGDTTAQNESGTGDDTMSGGAGGDELRGQDGADQLSGDAGGDVLYGGAGDDTLDGGSENDSLTGGTSLSTSIVEVATGDDTIDGGAGDDLLLGHDGNDTLAGDDGADRLYAGSGTDTLEGGAGNDLLEGVAAGGIATLVYAGTRADYRLTELSSGRIEIVDLRSGSPEGTDDAANVQFVRFADGTFALGDLLNAPIGPVGDADGSADTVAENAANGTLVGITARATDQDAGDTVSYSLTDSAGGRFTIDGTSGVVSVANGALLDFEAATSHGITVRAASSDGSSSTQAFTIAVGDVGEAGIGPVGDANAAADAVAENAANGTAVGITASASDTDAGDTVSYSLTDSAGGRFAIDSVTGVVTVANGALLDRETAPSHGITVRAASSDGSSSTQGFTVALGDVDEFDVSAVADSNGAANSVAENAANGTAVGITASAADADATNNTISYSLTDDAGGRFTIDGPTGVVSVANGALLDFGAATSHGITVRASSSDGSSSTQNFTIAVSDVGEGSVGAVTDNDGAANSVAENAANGSAVGITASASDPDAGDTVSYSLTDSAGGRFTIDATSGVVTVADGTLLDREAASSHDITVRAASSDGSSSTRGFTIALGDVDEFDVSAVLDTNSTPDTVAENAPSGTLVGITASASDADATNNTVSYSLSDDAGGRFAIDAATGIVTVADGTLLDYETASSHDIIVRAASSDGSSSTQAFTVAVGDVAEGGNQTPVITSNGGGASAAVAVAENGKAITTVTATDADLPAQTLSYSIVGGADAGSMAIDADTGALRFVGAPDYETPTDADGDNVYEVVVGVADGNGGSDTQAIAVSVTDVAGVTKNGNARWNVLFGGGEGDTLNGLGGNDALWGLQGNDTLRGGTGADLLVGDGGNDTLDGGQGSDVLLGGSDADTLDGGDGNDVLTGQAGADVLRGGAGSDLFDFELLSDSHPSSGVDVITDFARGSDRIGLALIDANAGARGNQAFSGSLLAGLGCAFTGAGQLRFGYDSATDQTIVQGNVDGDLSTVDFEIHLAGNVPLTGSDFIL